MRSLRAFSDKILDHFGVSQKRNFICVLTIFALFSIIFAFVSTFMNLKIQNLQVFSQNWMPFVLALPYVGSFCGTLFFSYFAKKYSLKKMIILAFFFLWGGYLSLFFLLETYAGGFLLFFFGLLYRWIFLVLYVYQGKLFASMYQARLFSFAGLLYGLAVAFGSFGISQVSFEKGIIFAILLVLVCLLISFRIKKDPKKEPACPLEESLTREFSYLKMILQNPLFFLIVFVGYVTFYGFSTYYPFFGERLGLTEAEAGSFLAYAQFFGLFLMPIGGYLGDKYGHEKSIFFIILLSFGVIGASFLTENVSLLSVLFSIAQGGMFAFYTLTTAWVAFLYPSSNLIKGMAVLNLVGQAGGMISPFGMGVIMHFFGNEGFIGWFFMGTAVVLGLLLMRMISHKKMKGGS
ncbi:MAG TPA: MFS transporter [Alphaproteobacteria bacterium]|nr:MFS transporter [Alphaproteobacteria bacterium]HQS93357.1 MFS transporter [Alphaproteobacteria bacterium]